MNAPAPQAELEISCHAVSARLQSGDDFVFIDCREQEEHAVVRIDGANLIPMSEFAQRFTELTPHREQEIVIHCHHGGRSLRVAMWLREQGFPRALSMAGGIDLWAVEIDPALPRY